MIEILVGESGIEILAHAAVADEVLGREERDDENEKIVGEICEQHLQVNL